MSAAPAVLVVMAKRPQPGSVKTRMCPPLAPEEAAELYAAMLEDVLVATAAAAELAGAALWLMVQPPAAVPELRARFPQPDEVRGQRGPDLAARMAHAVAGAARAGFGRILLRGSDSPAVPAADLLGGLDALAEVDLAVGPDSDGGYAWIALGRPQPGLFDHPMSTATALEDTLANASAAGLGVRRLAPQFDLDTVEDLALLARARREGGAAECPRTLALLDARKHWNHLQLP